MVFRNKTCRIFSIIFLFCSTYLFAQPVRASEKFDPMAKFGLNAEHLTSEKTRAADSLDCTLVGGWFTGPSFAVCVIDTLAYIGAGQAMKILNVKDSTNPVLLGEISLPCCLIFDIFVKGTLAYVADGLDGLRIINVANPSSPFEVGFYDTPDYTYGVKIEQDTLAYLADGSGGLRILNVANPAYMTEIGQYPGGHFGSYFGGGIWVKDTVVYITNTWDKGLFIINAANPSSPSWIGYYDSIYANSIYIQDTLAYLGGGELHILNISNPDSVIKVGSYDYNDDEYYIADILVKDTLAYLGLNTIDEEVDSNRLQIINISDPASIKDIGLFIVPGSIWALGIEGNFAYVDFYNRDLGSYGFLIIDVSTLSSPFQTGTYGLGGRNCEVWVKDSLAYVAAYSRGLSIINVSDPSGPFEIGFFDTQGKAYDVFVQDTFAYVADGDSGLSIINISDPYHPTETGFCDSLGWSVGVWVQDTFAYVADRSSIVNGGVRIINVADPSSPDEVGFYYETLREACNVWVKDTFAYVADGDSGLRILNVSDPASISEIGSSPGAFTNLYISDTLAYVIDDYKGGLHIIGISNPSSPVEIGSCNTPGDYNEGIWVQDGLAYISGLIDNPSYTASLFIVDVTNPASPVEAGFYNMHDEFCPSGVYVKDSLAYVGYDVHGLYIFKYTGPVSGIEEFKPEKTTFNISSISNTINIDYSIVTEKEKVKIEIFNILGQKVASPVDGIKDRGNYTLNWSGKTGIYFVKTEIGKKTYKEKALLLK